MKERISAFKGSRPLGGSNTDIHSLEVRLLLECVLAASGGRPMRGVPGCILATLVLVIWCIPCLHTIPPCMSCQSPLVSPSRPDLHSMLLAKAAEVMAVGRESIVLQLRGGGGEEMLAHHGDLVVPELSGGGFASFWDVVAHVGDGGESRREDGEGHRSVLVRSGGGEDAYRWDYQGVLRFPGRLKIRGTDGVELRGMGEFLEGSRGDLTKLRWAWVPNPVFPYGSGLRAGINFRGGNWSMVNCQLRASETTVVAVEEGAVSSLDDCYVGGFASGGTSSRYDMAVPHATDGVYVGGNATFKSVDCTLQYCGAWGGAALRATGNSSVTMDSCLLLHNDNHALSLHQSASVQLCFCSMLQHGGPFISATLAPYARLTLRNITHDGKLWADSGRPGVLCEEGEEGETTLLRPKLKVREPFDREADKNACKLEALYMEVEEFAKDISDEWGAAVQEMRDAETATRYLEQVIAEAGGVSRRVETGRQKLQERVEMTMDEETAAEMMGVRTAGSKAGNSDVTPTVQTRGKKRKLEPLLQEERAPFDERVEVTVQGGGAVDEFEDLPPMLLATFREPAGADATLCVYVHMEPLLLSALRDPSVIADGDALVVENSDRLLLRRSIGGDAARALAWICGIRALRDSSLGARCHLNIIFDFLEEAHKPLLAKRLAKMAEDGGPLAGADAVICSGGSWLSPSRPALLCGTRGLASVFVRVTPRCPPPDPDADAADGQAAASNMADDDELILPPIHSGTHGGALKAEPMSDMVRLLASLHRPDGSVAVPGIASFDRPPAGQELEVVSSASFDLPGYSSSILGDAEMAHLSGASPAELLSRVWTRPSISIHGIQGGWNRPGVKCLIPLYVTGKIGVRLTPGLSPSAAAELVRGHLEAEMRSSPNELKVWLQYGCDAWRSDTGSDVHHAIARATERVHGVPPELIYDGASCPAAVLLAQSAPRLPVAVLPLGMRDEDCEADQSFFRMQDYLLAGVKVAATVMYEMAQLRSDKGAKVVQTARGRSKGR